MPDRDDLLLETDPKAYLDAMAEGSSRLRNLRHVKSELLGELTDDELLAVARWIRAVSWAALDGARKLEQIVRART